MILSLISTAFEIGFHTAILEYSYSARSYFICDETVKT